MLFVSRFFDFILFYLKQQKSSKNNFSCCKTSRFIKIWYSFVFCLAIFFIFISNKLQTSYACINTSIQSEQSRERRIIITANYFIQSSINFHWIKMNVCDANAMERELNLIFYSLSLEKPLLQLKNSFIFSFSFLFSFYSFFAHFMCFRC